MTDQKALQLLQMLDDYYREYGADVDTNLTVHELVADIVESMDHGLNTSTARRHQIHIVDFTGTRAWRA